MIKKINLMSVILAALMASNVSASEDLSGGITEAQSPQLSSLNTPAQIPEVKSLALVEKFHPHSLIPMMELSTLKDTLSLARTSRIMQSRLNIYLLGSEFLHQDYLSELLGIQDYLSELLGIMLVMPHPRIDRAFTSALFEALPSSDQALEILNRVLEIKNRHPDCLLNTELECFLADGLSKCPYAFIQEFYTNAVNPNVLSLDFLQKTATRNHSIFRAIRHIAENQLRDDLINRLGLQPYIDFHNQIKEADLHGRLDLENNTGQNQDMKAFGFMMIATDTAEHFSSRINAATTLGECGEVYKSQAAQILLSMVTEIKYDTLKLKVAQALGKLGEEYKARAIVILVSIKQTPLVETALAELKA
jgi:hypothetical protein